jgi:hypothetical protein
MTIQSPNIGLLCVCASTGIHSSVDYGWQDRENEIGMRITMIFVWEIQIVFICGFSARF